MLLYSIFLCDILQGFCIKDLDLVCDYLFIDILEVLEWNFKGLLPFYLFQNQLILGNKVTNICNLQECGVFKIFPGFVFLITKLTMTHMYFFCFVIIGDENVICFVIVYLVTFYLFVVFI